MHKRDLTKGSIYSNLIYMALPTMFGFFAQTLFSLVDMVFIGQISKEALAGVTIYSTIFVIVFVFNDIIGTSSIALISQSYGEKDYAKTSKIIEQSIIFKAIVALITGIMMSIFLKPLIFFFTDNPQTQQAALDYGYIRTFFLPIMFSSYTVNTAMRCIGDSKKPLYIMIIVSIINIVLDPIFMFESISIGSFVVPGLNLGVFGAALATVISNTIAFLLAFYILLSGKTYLTINPRNLLKLDKDIDKKLITIGLPAGAEGLNRNLANFVLLKFISSYGVGITASYGIVIRILDLCFMPLFGLNMGGSTIIGQNLGAKNEPRAHQTIRATAKLGVFIMCCVNVGIFFYGQQLVAVFSNDTEVIEIGTTMLKWIGPSTILLAIMFGYGTAFSGSGYNKPFLYASVISRWGVLIPLAAVFKLVFHMDYHGLLIAYILTELVDMSVILYHYAQGKWKNLKL